MTPCPSPDRKQRALAQQQTLHCHSICLRQLRIGYQYPSTCYPRQQRSKAEEIKAEEIEAEEADPSPLSNTVDPMTEDNLPEGTDKQTTAPEEPFPQASELKAEGAEASSFLNVPDPMFEEDSDLPSTES